MIRTGSDQEEEQQAARLAVRESIVLFCVTCFVVRAGNDSCELIIIWFSTVIFNRIMSNSAFGFHS